MGEYLYFNKHTFRELIKAWRVLGCADWYDFGNKDDDWLMKQFMPIRFVADILSQAYEVRRANNGTTK